MPLRIGIDLVRPESVRESVAVHGERYLNRVYSEREVADCRRGGELQAERLAARFAAKEATIKVLRPGRDDPVGWRDVEVGDDASGCPELSLSGTAGTIADLAGIIGLTLSLSHTAGLVAAVVIAETRSSDWSTTGHRERQDPTSYP